MLRQSFMNVEIAQSDFTHVVSHIIILMLKMGINQACMYCQKIVTKSEYDQQEQYIRLEKPKSAGLS